MPEMRFRVRWPDETTSVCYSPSLIVKEYFQVGQSYPLDDFVQRSTDALTIAGQRVKEKYGFFCSGASGQLAEIQRTASRFTQPDARVHVDGFDE